MTIWWNVYIKRSIVRRTNLVCNIANCFYAYKGYKKLGISPPWENVQTRNKNEVSIQCIVQKYFFMSNILLFRSYMCIRYLSINITCKRRLTCCILTDIYCFYAFLRKRWMSENESNVKNWRNLQSIRNLKI